MKKMMKPGSWNFGKAKVKAYGCRNCTHNPMGICETVQQEIPTGFILGNGSPKWCPLKKKKTK